MKILVCFKTVCNLEHSTPKELCSLRNGTLNVELFGRRLGNYDEAALENALRTADALKARGDEVTLHAAAIGEKDEQYGRELYALGFQKVTYLDFKEEQDFTYRPELTAAVLRVYIEEECGYDMIFMGKQAGMGENGMTPFLLAESLQMPCVSDIYSIKAVKQGIGVISQTGNKMIKRIVIKPAIYIMGEAEHPYLRMATLREKITCREKEVYHIKTDLPNVQVHSPGFQKFIYEFQEKQCRMIESGTPRDKAQTLWDTQLKGLVKL